jgi:hypothetical protein
MVLSLYEFYILSSWFEPDNIREGVSLARIHQIGGIEGLLERLKVTEKVYCSFVLLICIRVD